MPWSRTSPTAVAWPTSTSSLSSWLLKPRTWTRIIPTMACICSEKATRTGLESWILILKNKRKLSEVSIYQVITKQHRYKSLQKHLSESIKTKKIGLLTVNLLTARFLLYIMYVWFFVVKRKKEHQPLLNSRKALLAPLLHLGSPFGFLLCFNYCFWTFKVPYLVGLLLKRACCLLRQLLQRMLLLLRMQFLILT